MRRLLKWFRQTPRTSTPPRRPYRPALEALEDRTVPTVTYHGGALLRNVEVQAVYYGSDWGSPPFQPWLRSPYAGTESYLDGFLKSAVNGSYMDMLNTAGYLVGRGSASTGQVCGATLNKSVLLTDSSIRTTLQSWISAGALQQPDGNRLYVVYVEPNVAISRDGQVSNPPPGVYGFYGYHDQVTVNGQTVPYAVIAYPGGTVNNLARSWLSALNQLTLVTSHEFAEGVTDPYYNPSTGNALGWNDDAYGARREGEVGDIVNGETVYLNGYAVQCIADQNDQPMTPAGAAAVNPVNFVLRKDGSLYMSSGSGLTYLGGTIASISDQGIDNLGHAMIDAVTSGGAALEFHEGSGWTRLMDSGVKSARAGQGVSYILSTNGTVYEFKDSVGIPSQILSNVTAIDAGTDRYGVNMVAGVYGGWLGFEYSDSGGWRGLASGVQAVSAGQQGNLVILYANGTAWRYNEATGSSVNLRSNVAAVIVGTDQYGKYLIELLGTDGNLYEYGAGDRLTRIFGGVTAAGKPHGGTVDVVFYWADAYSYDPTGFGHLLSSNAVAAV
jgi:hypothetical protein